MTERPIFPAEWNVGSYVPLADTHSSLVWKVERNDFPDEVFVVKQLKPAGMEELRGTHYLSWRDGHGAAKLYDLKETSMLLEYAGGYHLDEQLKSGKDEECLAIFGQVLTALHQPSASPVPDDLQPLNKHFSGLFAVASHKPIYAEATELAKRLLEMPREAIPLHGDIHHENVMRGPRGWLVIDPHGLMGDAAFDAANIFYNPLDRDDLCLNLERAQRMAEHFAPILRCDPAYVLDFAFSYGCLSAAWHREDRNDADEARELKIASALRHLRQTAYSL
ncbi:aminoglycoside phosphotransferase family protein [Ochrobactrum sp. AN78]|uniref:aminoglycoside phosphotransferase family protein n=1 Tax=Ochrobactrum sp. AN78 TaxID=3039853 RepID=UPI002989DAEA|nr:aminoglycoside phosphotransferase family protein [Ochrobactrum sp. AN78]MDH7791806.1 streptomycin 6-kinase [Ochrobactrum sp. AN78]